MSEENDMLNAFVVAVTEPFISHSLVHILQLIYFFFYLIQRVLKVDFIRVKEVPMMNIFMK